MTAEEEIASWCQFSRCSSQSTIVYLGMGLCDPHWIQIAELSSKEAKKKLKIKELKNAEAQEEEIEKEKDNSKI